MKFYKFDSEEQFFSVTIPEGVNISVIGLIPETLIEGEETVYKEGWHVNSDKELPDCEDFEIFPSNPMRIFA